MTMTPGDIRKTDGVVFTCTADGEATARSEADTSGDTTVHLTVLKRGVIHPSVRAEGQSSYEFKTWNEAAETLKQNLFDQEDKNREEVVDLRREFDALPRYQGSRRKVGKVVLEHTADGHVMGRAVSDTTGADTGVVIEYSQGHLSVGTGGVFPQTWAEAIERLTPRMDAYEKGLQEENEIKTAFGELPAGP